MGVLAVISVWCCVMWCSMVIYVCTVFVMFVMMCVLMCVIVRYVVFSLCSRFAMCCACGCL